MCRRSSSLRFEHFRTVVWTTNPSTEACWTPGPQCARGWNFPSMRWLKWKRSLTFSNSPYRWKHYTIHRIRIKKNPSVFCRIAPQLLLTSMVKKIYQYRQAFFLFSNPRPIKKSLKLQKWEFEKNSENCFNWLVSNPGKINVLESATENRIVVAAIIIVLPSKRRKKENKNWRVSIFESRRNSFYLLSPFQVQFFVF